jgi:ABC-type multidrug transport system fused ATPase/permease subunit
MFSLSQLNEPIQTKIILYKLLKWASAYWPLYGLMGIIIFLSALVPVGNAEGIRRLFNAVYDKSIPQLWGAAGFYLAVFFTVFLLEIARTWLSQRLSNRTTLDLQSEMIDRLFNMKLLHIGMWHTGDKLQRMNESAVASQDGMNKHIPRMIERVLSISFLFIYLTVLSWKLLAGAMVIAIVIPLLSNLMAKPIRNWQTKANQSQAIQDANIQDQMQAPDVVRVFNLRESFNKKWSQQVQITNKGRMNIQLWKNASDLTVYVGFWIGLIYIFGMGAWMMSNEEIRIGAIASFVITFEQLVYPIFYILSIWTSVQNSIAHAGRVFEIIDPTEQKPPPEGEGFLPLQGDLIFDQVSFSYVQDESVLSNCSIVIKQGCTTALVGVSGGGKSTILKIALGLHYPDNGAVHLGGSPIDQSTLGTWRKRVAYVPQDATLFDTSVIDNIRVGRLDATIDEVIQAAKSAQAHDFISKLPRKYETRLGEHGQRLSGGERQRLSIARAYVRNPDFLILDEPTSSLDGQNEIMMQETLSQLMESRTVLVVAHRLSTIRHADCIIVVDNGCAVESGTHEELMQRKGRYSALIEGGQWAEQVEGSGVL